MTNLKAGLLGVVGTLATIALDQINLWIACACGLLTLVLLLRKVAFVLLADWRAYRARRIFPFSRRNKTRRRGGDWSD